jgi:hypothetical protein
MKKQPAIQPCLPIAFGEVVDSFIIIFAGGESLAGRVARFRSRHVHRKMQIDHSRYLDVANTVALGQLKTRCIPDVAQDAINATASLHFLAGRDPSRRSWF